MVSRTATAERSIPDSEAITKYFALATCAWLRTVGDNAMILPSCSDTRMDNTQNLWKHASNLRKRSHHAGVVARAPPWRTIMKKLIAILTIVTLIAVPAFLQSVTAAPVSPSSSSFGGNGY